MLRFYDRRPCYSLDVRNLDRVRFRDQHYEPPVETAPAAAAATVPADVRPRPSIRPAVIRFSCPACGHKLKARADHGGRLGRCRACGSQFTIPTPDDARPAVA